MVLTQMHVQPEVQNIIIGGLLLVSVVLPGGGEAVGRLRARLRKVLTWPRARRPTRAAKLIGIPACNQREK